jgi:hypothetical protein
MRYALLDLDEPSTWESQFRRIVAEVAQSEYETLYDDITVAEEHVKTPLGRAMRGQAAATFLSEYTHVAAYHGCRIADSRSYLTRGIERSNPEAIIDGLRAILPEHVEAIDRATEELARENRYIEWNRGKVGLLLSEKWARAQRIDYARGSELARGILNRIADPDAIQRFARTGRPSLIKCAVPVDWLDNHTTFKIASSYYCAPLAKLLYATMYPQENGDHADAVGVTGGYLLMRDIPSECILKIIDMSDVVPDREWVDDIQGAMVRRQRVH